MTENIKLDFNEFSPTVFSVYELHPAFMESFQQEAVFLNLYTTNLRLKLVAEQHWTNVLTER